MTDKSLHNFSVFVSGAIKNFISDRIIW